MNDYQKNSSCIFLPEVKCPLMMEAVRGPEFRASCWSEFNVTWGTKRKKKKCQVLIFRTQVTQFPKRVS